MSLFTHDALFYVGLATFLYVTDRVQRPYLQYSSKRWGLITGLRGYLFSAFLTMGLKIVVPVILLFATWSSSLGMAGIVAVTPFLLGCAVQFAFEKVLDNRGSACWPLVPAIFEVCLLSFRLFKRMVCNWNIALLVISFITFWMVLAGIQTPSAYKSC